MAGGVLRAAQAWGPMRRSARTLSDPRAALVRATRDGTSKRTRRSKPTLLALREPCQERRREAALHEEGAGLRSRRAGARMPRPSVSSLCCHSDRAEFGQAAAAIRSAASRGSDHAELELGGLRHAA